jgi:hypothetical protein
MRNSAVDAHVSLADFRFRYLVAINKPASRTPIPRLKERGWLFLPLRVFLSPLFGFSTMMASIFMLMVFLQVSAASAWVLLL